MERLDGIEFTIMGITDGEHLVIPPASYDYPFRHEGDRGAGTGGMGCFTNSEKRLPFMSEQDLDDCRQIMQRIIDEMRKAGSRFNGVLNGGFFKTPAGIKFMEFNGRFGDPEGLNILSILETSFSDLLVHIWSGTLSDKAVSFAKKAGVVKYLVANEYPCGKPEPGHELAEWPQSPVHAWWSGKSFRFLVMATQVPCRICAVPPVYERILPGRLRTDTVWADAVMPSCYLALLMVCARPQEGQPSF